MSDSTPFANIKKFENYFSEYYKLLCYIAYGYVQDKAIAEDVVSDVFLNFWHKREEIKVKSNLKSYLVNSVKNQALQYLRKERFPHQSIDNIEIDYHIPWSDSYPLGELIDSELYNELKKAVDSLPKQCRLVFLMSKGQELSYQVIAKELEISENTVKYHMKTALRKLREYMESVGQKY